MKQGETAFLKCLLKVNIDEIDEIIFTMKDIYGGVVQVVYPDIVEYRDGVFLIPLFQESTLTVRGKVNFEAQINYKNKSVKKTIIETLTIGDTLATKLVNNNFPADNNDEVLALDTEEVTIFIPLTDKTLTKENTPADAKIVGDKFKKAETTINTLADNVDAEFENIKNTTDALFESITTINTTMGEFEGIVDSRFNEVSNTTNDLANSIIDLNAQTTTKFSDIDSALDTLDKSIVDLGTSTNKKFDEVQGDLEGLETSIETLNDEVVKNIKIGTVETTEEGTPATVKATTTDNETTLDFAIPKGDKGEKGDKGTFEGMIVDNLTSDSTTDVLSANMGRQLNSNISGVEEKIFTEKSNDIRYAFSSDVPNNPESDLAWYTTVEDALNSYTGDKKYFWKKLKFINNVGENKIKIEVFPYVNVANNLESTSSTDALSANMGKQLKENLITATTIEDYDEETINTYVSEDVNWNEEVTE